MFVRSPWDWPHDCSLPPLLHWPHGTRYLGLV